MSVIEKLYVYGGIGYLFFVLISITVFYVMHRIINNYKKYCKVNKQYRKEIHKNNLNVNLDYIKVKQLFNQSIRHKQLSRGGILKFKDKLNIMLQKDIEHYKDFYFQNDAHEIYTKLKCNSLNQFDYIQLYNYLSTLFKSQK